jgi:hypothetical protein
MGSYARYLSFSIILMIMVLPLASADTIEDSADIDIDTYKTIEIEFKDGESLELKAIITADPDPVTVFLIKGDQEYQKWKETEDIDINAILAGENVTSSNSTFKVIQSFSQENTRFFEGSLSIGEKDTYYLVITIHREEDMSKDDILSRAARVDYIVEYKEKEKDVPYYLIPIAVIIFLIGLVLIVIGVRSMRADSTEPEEKVPERRPPVRRSPPMR